MLKWTVITACAALAACSLGPDEVHLGVGGTVPEDRTISLRQHDADYDQRVRGDMDLSLWVLGVWHTRPREVVVMETVAPRPVDFSGLGDPDPGEDEVAGIVGNVSAGLQIAEDTSWVTIWKLVGLIGAVGLAGWLYLWLRARYRSRNGR